MTPNENKPREFTVNERDMIVSSKGICQYKGTPPKATQVVEVIEYSALVAKDKEINALKSELEQIKEDLDELNLLKAEKFILQSQLETAVSALEKIANLNPGESMIGDAIKMATIAEQTLEQLKQGQKVKDE